MNSLKKVLCISLGLSFAFFGTSYLYAEDEDSGSSSTSLLDGYEEHLKIEGQQLEDYEMNFNPLLREMYGGYKRNGNFKLLKSNGTVLNATAIHVKWEGNPTTQYFVVNGKEVKKGSGDTVREITTYEDQPFVLKKDMKVAYSEPFEEKVIKGQTVKAGTYISSCSSMDFVQITLDNGKKVWINPQYTPNFQTTSNGYFEKTVGILPDQKINGVPVKQKLMKVIEGNRTGIPMRPTYVTIHNTGNSDAGAGAETHANLQYNNNGNYVSWHFTVDNKEIYQSMPMNEVAWHAGDGLNMGNGSSIAIEICENKDGNYAQAEKNAAYLAAHILYENGLPADAIRMHKDWSGKDCPYNIIHGTKGTMGWEKFKQTVTAEYNRLVEENKVPEEVTGTLPDNLQEFFKNQNMKYDQGYLSGLDLGQKASDVAAKIAGFEENSTVSITDAKGKELAADTLIATGQKISIKNAEGKEFKITVVIKADVNGDGKIQATDYVKIKNKIMDKGTLSGAYLKAADVNLDGKVLATDYVKIKNHIMGKGQISQH